MERLKHEKKAAQARTPNKMVLLVRRKRSTRAQGKHPGFPGSFLSGGFGAVFHPTLLVRDVNKWGPARTRHHEGDASAQAVSYLTFLDVLSTSQNLIEIFKDLHQWNKI